MENKMGWEQSLIYMLAQVEEQTKQLEAHLDAATPSQMCKPLAQKIRSTICTAITMVTEGSQLHGGSDSPRSASDSPRSENSGRAFTDERRELSKKRKTMPKWSSQVRVGSGSGTEAPMDDGYSWRKYGQKDILGAHHPRAYYRCTHRNSRGCPATKQVQRSDEDPFVFDVIYRGDHICVENTQMIPCQQNQFQQPPPPAAALHTELIPGFQTGLHVKTQVIDLEAQDPASSFSFPSTPSSFAPAFVSNTSSPTLGGIADTFGAGQSELAEIFAAATVAEDSPVVDMNFGLDQVELDTAFPYDNSNFRWW
uniref:Transcription factor WRKY12 n=1 Tax=Lilium regale TaxID=82328 RepID=A0A894THC9_LILRE|nr:transcription factor WRKY12 [Lilium regale]